MAIQLVTRAQWGARSPRGSYDTLRSTRGVKVHYTGGRVDPAIVNDHAKCVTLVRQIQNSHMDGNGWIDIGYSMIACPHRKVFVGRGAHALPAANGPGLNTGHYAVLALVGNAGLTQPPDGMLHGILDAIEYLRANGGAGREIKGHRDGFATACPGEPLYAWMRRGAPRPAAPAPESWTEDLVRDLPMLRAGALPEGDPRRWDVKTLYYLLHARGYPVPSSVADTVFTSQMEDAVRAFQRAKKLTVDGIVGPQTWSALLRVN